jgi:cytoskeleton protein RodZ
MAEGIGARLRGARERSRLTILQAAERLHLDPDILEALEAENFAALGAPVYVKGHLRHYAELLGEPVAPLFELYAQGAGVPAPDLTRIPRAARDDAGRLVAPAVTVVILFAACGTAWWLLTLSHEHWGSAPVAVVPAQAAASLQPAQPMTARAAAVRAAGAVPAAAASVAKLPPSSAAAAGSAAPLRGEIAATFKYAADSWTEVYDASGRRLLYGLAAAPATHTLDGLPPLSVTLGDASGVTIEVDGREPSIARFVRPDHTARFLIAADGRLLAAPPKKGD